MRRAVGRSSLLLSILLFFDAEHCVDLGLRRSLVDFGTSGAYKPALWYRPCSFSLNTRDCTRGFGRIMARLRIYFPKEQGRA